MPKKLQRQTKAMWKDPLIKNMGTPCAGCKPEQSIRASLIDRDLNQVVHGCAFNQVFLHDALDAFFFEISIPNAFRIDHHIRPIPALTETTGKCDTGLFEQSVLFQSSLQVLQYFFGLLVFAGRARADKQVKIRRAQSLMPSDVIRGGRYFHNKPSKKSWPLSSTIIKAGKSFTVIRKMASMPNSV